MSVPTYAVCSVLLVAAGLLSSCGQAASSPTGATASLTAVPAPRHTDRTVADRCNIPVEGELTTFPGSGGTVISGAVYGRADRAAVFLHQTAMAGMCGFATYAVWAARHGVRAIIVDLCGWGQSWCAGSDDDDWAAQVRIPVDWARAHGARSVTLVGASLGGAIALGIGQQVGADAIVDLSGPSSWPGVPDALPSARRTTIPLMVAAASGDTGIGVEALKRAVAASPATHKRFVPAPDGHGWSMLSDGMAVDPQFTPLATTVLAWVKGDYSG
jgi:hypothetical protein